MEGPTTLNDSVLHLAQDDGRRWQTREWRLQRIAWGAAWLVLLLAMLGVFSDGPLSDAKAVSPDGSVEVAYERFVRDNGPAVLEITVPAEFVEGDTATLVLRGKWTEAVRIESISPTPDTESALGTGRVYEIGVEAGRDAVITVDYRPQSAGISSGSVSIAPDAPAAQLRQLTYP
jgi:hypothetical protein